MTYTVEYSLCQEMNNAPHMIPFRTVDDALKFVNDMRQQFKEALEWIYIHCSSN